MAANTLIRPGRTPRPSGPPIDPSASGRPLGGCAFAFARGLGFVPCFLIAAIGCSPGDSTGDDAGVTVDAGPAPIWRVEPGVPTQEDLLAIWGRAADDVWAVGWNGTIVHYDGIAWSLESSTSTAPLTAVHGLQPPADPDPTMPVPPGPVFAVGWGGTILERGAGGAWAPALSTSTATDDLFGVFVGADDSALAVGDSGRILSWDGTMWQLARLLVPGDFSGELLEPKGVLKGVWSGNGRRYYISGSGGAAYRSTGGTVTFEALDTRVSDPLRGIWGTANDNVYTVGLDALILRFNGQWRRISNDGADVLPRVFLVAVHGRSPEDITLVGWRGTAVRWDGATWVAEPTGIQTDLRGVWVDPATGLAFAVGASGTVIRRDAPPPPPAME